MKVVILAGGLPSTLIEEDERVPKPMAEIGGRPILWHIMKQYSYYGYNDFIICTGYKGELIKDYFMNYYIYQSDITVDLQTNDIMIHRKQTENWKVSVIDTGIQSSITERIIKLQDYLAGESFIVSYGDCVSDIDVQKMVRMHQKEGKTATIAVTRPTGRNEILPIDDEGKWKEFAEQQRSNSWVNACNMIFDYNIYKYIEKEHDLLDSYMIKKLADDNEIQAYRHEGFWSPMETARDKKMLETYWNENRAPWKVWENQESGNNR